MQLQAKDPVFSVPFYPKGLGALIAALPLAYGRKASGFRHPLIDSKLVSSPLSMQLAKVYSMVGGVTPFEERFDRWVADRISSGLWRPKLFITLQDYMPLSTRMAHKYGAVLWSDQILNSSDRTSERIKRHCRGFGIEYQAPSEVNNDWILSNANIITAPSRFVMDGLVGRTNPSAVIYRIPYGVDFDEFKPRSDFRPDSTILHIVARANSVRKGGHLLLEAIAKCGDRLPKLSQRKKLHVTFVGKLSIELMPLLSRARAVTACTIEHGNISHLDLPELFSSADFLVMPTLAEGMSLIIPEALACGLPVLSTEFSGVDYLIDGKNGVVSEDSLESLIASLEKMILLLSDWRVIRKNARESVIGNGWLEYSNGISAVLRESFIDL